MDKKPLKTIDAWKEYALRNQEAGVEWMKRLKSLKKQKFEEILDKIPEDRMSAIAKAFTLELLLENQRRLLEGEGL